MRPALFVERYEAPKTQDFDAIEQLGVGVELCEDVKELYAGSRAWSDVFSGLLHGQLSGEDTPEPQEFVELLNHYKRWCFQTRPGLHTRYRELLQYDSPDNEKTSREGTKERRHSLFHDFNIHFLDSWTHALGLKSETTATEAALRAKFALAQIGCILARGRDGLSETIGEAGYFLPEFSTGRSLQEGWLHEIDSAIILLTIAANKKRPLVVLPGPSRFEYMAAENEMFNTNANADFIVIDPATKEVVGVQVKSQVSDQTVERYDHDRIVLLDTKVDLGSQAAKQTERRSSNKKVVSWAGMIAVEAISAIGLRTPEGQYLLKSGNMGLKSYSTKALKGFNPHIRVSVARIEPRLFAKL